jgi:3-keto-disaccharide hydrolase
MRIRGCFDGLLLLAVAAAMVPAARAQRHNTVSFEEGEEGWYPLFDGRSLDGWIVPPDSDWRVVDGEIVSEAGGSNLLIYDETFSDFELKVDFLAAPSANSGVFVRVSAKALAPGVKAYEVNIAPPGNPNPTGSIIHLEAGASGAPPKFGAIQKANAGESTEWRTYDIEARGSKLTIKIDGEVIAELDDPEPLAEGYIALQHNTGKVQFRNVKMRRLK